MLAMFTLGTQEMIVLLLILALILAIVLPIALRQKWPIEPGGASSPLDRAKAAAAVLTPTEREELRHSLEESRPKHSHGSEGIQ